MLSELIKEAQHGPEQGQHAQRADAAAAATTAAALRRGGGSGLRLRELPAPRMPAGAALRMDENLTVLEDIVGGCERILRTPIPLRWVLSAGT